MPELLSTAAGPPAVRLLQQVVSARQAEDRLAPVTVVVPSNYSALSLRRRLAAAPPGLVNVAFLVLGRLAELLGGPGLARAGRRPLSPAVLAHAVRQALAAAPGCFKEVASHPATERALVRAYRDLRALSPPALDSLSARGERTGDVVRLVRAVRATLAPDWYDEADLLLAAAAAARAHAGAHPDIGHVIVYAPGRLAPPEQVLLDALGSRVTVIDVVLERESPPPVDEIVGAPDPDQEVRAALRGVMERLGQGVPLHRMAVLYPAAEPYALVLAQQVAAAGIPASGPAVRRLRDVVAGVTLLGLLRLPECGWRREDVMAWLASAPILDSAGAPVSAAPWDRASREAGVVEGAGQWQERLDRHIAALAEQVALAAARDEGNEAEDEPGRNTRGRFERAMARADGLRRFMADLVTAADPSACVTWSDYAAWAKAALARVLGGEADHRRWPDEEQEGWRQVLATLDRLAGLDAVVAGREPVELPTFVRALEQELDTPAGRLGTFGDGVFVAPLSSARATDFDTVFVLGLAEGTLPATDRRTGLIPELDADGEAADIHGGNSHHDHDDHDDLLAALAAAGERVLLWPRFDPRRGRERLPSRWLLHAAQSLTGASMLSAEDLAGAGHPGIVTIASFEAGLAHERAPASLADYDLASLTRWHAEGGSPRTHFLATEVPRLAVGLEAAAARAGARLTRYDGLVGADASAAAGLGAV
ncbi:MAG: ATP-dependent helicase/nuclease subunit, partial [Acidimicrobiaceae bacterium]|nr:ATP-dependent helicase/nuclease subunit [Acidimicrobiaceae bacterium]